MQAYCRQRLKMSPKCLLIACKMQADLRGIMQAFAGILQVTFCNLIKNNRDRAT
jgi:hypothetical protein